MMSKSEVGTFQSASSVALSNNDLRAGELVNADEDKGSIDCDFEGPLDSHKKLIFEALTKITHPLGSLPSETWANFAGVGFVGSG
jgi:hypothetical protein